MEVDLNNFNEAINKAFFEWLEWNRTNQPLWKDAADEEYRKREETRVLRKSSAQDSQS